MWLPRRTSPLVALESHVQVDGFIFLSFSVHLLTQMAQEAKMSGRAATGALLIESWGVGGGKRVLKAGKKEHLRIHPKSDLFRSDRPHVITSDLPLLM